MGAGGGTLHRTRRDGAADELLATGLAGPGNPAVDGDRVYWSEVRGGPGGGAGAIASLPLEAAPGTAPDRMVSLGLYDEVTSLAPAGGNLYWTFAAVGASRYLSSLSLAPVSALLGGQTTDRLYTDRRPYGLAPIGDTVALGSYLSSGTSAVAWLAPPDGPLRPVAVLPLESTVVGLAAVDELLLASAGPGPACGVAPSYGLYVIPRAGGARALAADGLAAPAAVGPWGAAYVDQGHTLLLLSVAALRRALDQGGGP
jgi:hypothetical protein